MGTRSQRHPLDHTAASTHWSRAESDKANGGVAQMSEGRACWEGNHAAAPGAMQEILKRRIYVIFAISCNDDVS